MRFFNKWKIFLFVFLYAALNPSSFSASDGTAGTTSTGTSTISVTKLDNVRITSMNDISFGGVVSAPNNQAFDACVYSTSGSYNVRATSSYGTGTSFRLKLAGFVNYITYDVQWNNSASGSSGTDLNHNVTSTTFSGANSSSQTCAGGENARIIISINAASFNGAAYGAYSDMLTILITPV